MYQKFQRVSSHTYCILCVIGCMYQLQLSLVGYLRFGTVTKTRYLVPQVINFPPLHFCFLCMEDMVNVTQVQDKYNITVNEDIPNELYNLMDIMTIEDILNFTPNDPLESCTYRDHTGNKIRFGNKEECLKIFEIQKYIIQQHLCYAVVARKDISVTFWSVERSLRYERLIFRIKLSEKHARSQKIRPTITNWRFPLIENAYSQSYYKKSGSDISIDISCSNVSVSFLGYPYDKFTCIKDGDMDYYQCVDSCLEKKTLINLSRLPHTSYHHKRSLNISFMKIVSTSMVDNDTISHLINDWTAECDAACPAFVCRYSYCNNVGNYGQRSAKQGTTIRVDSPPGPELRIAAVPMISLLDLFVYASSSLGTWFGFVFITFNPLNLFGNTCKHFKTRNIGGRTNRNDLILHTMVMRSRYHERYINALLDRSRIRAIQ